MPLRLNDLARQVVDRSWPEVDLSATAVDRVMQEALDSGALTLTDLHRELQRRTSGYRSIRVTVGDDRLPLHVLASVCEPDDEMVIHFLATGAIGYAAKLECDRRQGSLSTRPTHQPPPRARAMAGPSAVRRHVT